MIALRRKPTFGVDKSVELRPNDDAGPLARFAPPSPSGLYRTFVRQALQSIIAFLFDRFLSPSVFPSQLWEDKRQYRTSEKSERDNCTDKKRDPSKQ